jgi:hypothetical protein
MIARAVAVRLAALSLPLLAFAGAAQADAWTYGGTLGKTPIVVEFTRDPTAAGKPLAGRYFYPAQGIDIPLQPGNGGAIALNEEKPCTVKICKDPPDGQTAKPPIGATWSLKADAAGALTGTWKAAGGAAQPVALKRVGSRPTGKDFEDTPQALVDLTDQRIWSADPSISRQATPYDFLKMQATLTLGPETAWGDVAFRYVVDPRTRFHYPRISRLPGVADVAGIAADRYLQGRHWALNIGALDCKAQQYQGFGWREVYAGSAGTLGGFDEQTIEVSYLSPKLMSWTESGSLFCGGAHPENFTRSYTLDVAKGAPLDLSRIFKGWVAHKSGEADGPAIDLAIARAGAPDAYVWGPDKALVAFVDAHREKQDTETEKDCGLEDLVATNLAIRFARGERGVLGERVVFALEGLPHVIAACEGDLFDMPIIELKALLTPEAAEYFPELR